MKLLGMILAWAVVICVVTLAVGLGVSETLGKWIGTGLVFAAIAHVSSSSAWREVRDKDLFGKK